MTYTIVFVFFMFIQFVSPFIFIVVIDIICNIVCILMALFDPFLICVKIRKFRVGLEKSPKNIPKNRDIRHLNLQQHLEKLVQSDGSCACFTSLKEIVLLLPGIIGCCLGPFHESVVEQFGVKATIVVSI
ncbi:hypothetical protein ACJX0J_033606, partial [Zea mays]